MQPTDDGKNLDNIENESISADSQTHTPLQGVVSSPIPVRAKKSGLRSSNSNENGIDDDENGESLIIFTFAEWKAAFSRTHQKMKSEWRAIFQKKLEESGSVCTVNFRSPFFKKGQRKKNCRFFCCYGHCTTRICARNFTLIVEREPTIAKAPVVFMVRTAGKENHDCDVETAAVPLKGTEREAVGLCLHLNSRHENCLSLPFRKTCQRDWTNDTFQRACEECR